MTYPSLPEEGMTRTEIETVFDQLRSTDKDFRSSFGERWINDRGLLLDDGALEVVIPETGYPTFEKYNRYLGYTVRRVSVDEFCRADPKAISDRTFMILGSMSSWSHGACDPSPELANIAKKKNIWLHVDACVGGMLAPFARDLGREVTNFDFSNPEVSSISVDLHKYGYNSKGVSDLCLGKHDIEAT